MIHFELHTIDWNAISAIATTNATTAPNADTDISIVNLSH